MILEFPKILDSSMISSYKSCPRKFFLTYIQHYHGKEPSVHLHAGRAFASGIEAARSAYYINGLPSEDSVALGLEALLRDYGTFSCPPDSAKSAERMAGALEFYFQHFPLDHDSAVPIQLPSGERAIEFQGSNILPILHPDSGEPLIFSWRADAICSYAGGTFVTDEKTTTSLGPTWASQWDLRAQFSAYCWGCRQYRIKVDGCLIRGIAILKTKYDTQQAITYRPEWQVNRWYEETMDTITQMIKDWKQFAFDVGLVNDVPQWDPFPTFKHNLDSTCSDFGGCTFKQVCMSDPKGDSYQSILDTFFERRRWNPVSREEEKLS